MIQCYDGDGEKQNNTAIREVHADRNSWFNPYAGSDLFSSVDFRLHWKSAEAMQEALKLLEATAKVEPSDIHILLRDENYLVPHAYYVGRRSTDRLSTIVTLRYDKHHVIRAWNPPG